MDGDLHQQLQHLQARLDQVEARLGSLEAAPPPPVGGPIPVPPPPVAPPRPVPPRPGPAVNLDAATLIRWTGIALVTLAGAFLVSSAVSRGWIGPEAQTAGAFVIGAVLSADGHRRSATNRSWGVPLVTGGAVVLLVTAAASSAGVGVVGPPVALAWLAATSAAVTALALRLRAELVVAVAAPLAALLPLWIAEGTDLGDLAVGGIVTSIAVGSGLVALVAGWTVARVAAVTSGGASLLVAVGASPSTTMGTTTVATLVAAALVTALGWFGPPAARRSNPSTRSGLVVLDHRVVLHVPVASYLLVDAALPGGTIEDGILACALAAGFAVAAASLRHRLPGDLLASQLAGAMILLTIGLALATDGPTVLVALALQAAALGILARSLGDRLSALQAALYALVAVAWAGASLVAGLFEPLSVGAHLADLLVVAATVAAAGYGQRYRLPGLVRPAGLVGWVGALLWLADVLIHGPQGQVVVSVVWAVAAVVAVVIGVLRGEATARLVGLATLAVVVAKLLTVDLEAVDTLWRVGLFLVIGTGLLRLAYVLPRLSEAKET